MRLGLLLILAVLAGGCLDMSGWNWGDEALTAPPTPAYLRLAGSAPAPGNRLDPSGQVAFSFEYGTGSSGPGSAHDIQVEIAAPLGAGYTLPRPCVAGVYAVTGGRAACDVALAADWAQAAHPMAFTFSLIERDGGYLGTPYVGRVVATLGPIIYAN